MSSDPVVALEIGTSKVVALVGEMRNDGSIIVTGVGECESRGVRKGEIIDLEGSARCARTAIDAAELGSNVDVHEVFLTVTGGHIRSTINHGVLPITDPDGVITKEDIAQISEVAKAIRLDDDRTIIHTIYQGFQVDGQEKDNPIGMEGRLLELDMLILHGINSIIRNTMRTVRSFSVNVRDAFFQGLCSALSVLTPEQKQNGVMVIDLGAGTTDYVVYAKNVLATARAIGIGGDHVTNDIAKAFNIDQLRAEAIKKEDVDVFNRNIEKTDVLTMDPQVGFTTRNINRVSLNTVARVRIEELFTIIKDDIEKAGLLHHLGVGVVLTGGGAHLKGICEIAEEIFNLPAMVGRPINISGLSSELFEPEYAAPCGLIQHAFKTEEKRTSYSVTGWFRNLFGGR